MEKVGLEEVLVDCQGGAHAFYVDAPRCDARTTRSDRRAIACDVVATGLNGIAVRSDDERIAFDRPAMRFDIVATSTDAASMPSDTSTGRFDREGIHISPGGTQ